MKQDRILNPKLIRLIAAIGHTQTLVIADAGLPVPKGVLVLDLSLVRGVPSFQQVLDAVLEELVVEGCCLAEEMTQYNAELHQWVCSQMAGMPVDHVPHETFKVMTQQAQAIIRTGETSKYANIILYAGVNF